MSKQAPVFQAIDVASLKVEQADAFMAYLKAKSAFKASLQSLAPEGYNVVFTEKYGSVDKPLASSLKVALTKAATPKVQGKLNLSDWIDSRSSNGQAI